MEDQPVGESKPKNSKNLTIIIVGVIIVAVLIIGFSLVLKQMSASNNYQAPVAEDYGSYLIDENNLEEILGEMEAKVDDGMFSTEMNVEWSFPSGKEASTDAHVANSTANSSPVFFEVYLEDTGELIYTSTVIPVGAKLKDIVLDKELSSGVYPAVCKYNLLDDEGKVKSSVSVSVTLHIAQ